jgi:hypothetical protein
MKKEHQNIFEKVQSHLTQHPYQIPRTNRIFKDYSTRLLDQLTHSYHAPISHKDQTLASEQAHLAQSIRKKITKHQLILRVVDKGNHFYIGSTVNFERKVQNYFTDTNAFVQLSNNPFNEILNGITGVLQTLASKKWILQWQLRTMLPDPVTSELSHLYFNPKIHKVDSITLSTALENMSMVFYSSLIDRHTCSSHRAYATSCNDEDFQFLKSTHRTDLSREM